MESTRRISTAPLDGRAAPRAKILVVLVLCLLAPARMALADAEAGVAAFRGGDYATAVKELQVPAYDGNALAQYYMGVMHAQGLGVVPNAPEALKWFLCSESGSLPADLKRRAQELRRQLYSSMSLLEMDYAERAAANGCRSVEPLTAFDRGYNRSDIEAAFPRRSGFFAVVFFPGDVTMKGIVVVLDAMGFRSLTQAVLATIGTMGDLLLGLLALLGWVLISRVGYLLANQIWEWLSERQVEIGSGRRARGPGDEGTPRNRQ